MARNVKPCHLTRKDVLLHRASVMELTPSTLQEAFQKAFPFPLGSLAWGHRVVKKTPEGFEVEFAAVPRDRAEAIKNASGIVYHEDPVEPVLWIQKPMSKTLSPKLIMQLSVISTMFFLCMGVLNKRWEDHLFTIEQQHKQILLQSNRGASSFALSPLTLVSHLAQRTPEETRWVSLDIDFSKKTLQLQARGAQYGAISDLVSAIAAEPGMREVRSSTAKWTPGADETKVAFLVEARVP